MMDKNLFEDFEYHLLNDEKPSIYFKGLLEDNKLPKNSPYNMLYKLPTIDQEKKHHPEGNVWNHTMEVVDLAAFYKSYSRDERIFMWAALLHDLGKITTTKVRKGRITAYDHDREGAKMAKTFLESLTDDISLIKEVVGLVRWHMQPLFVYKDLPFARIKEMVNETYVSEVGLLSLCDRMGRGPLSDDKKEEVFKVITVFMEKCQDRVKDEEAFAINGLIKKFDEINKVTIS